jgi:hypothetical protein
MLGPGGFARRGGFEPALVMASATIAVAHLGVEFALLVRSLAGAGEIAFPGFAATLIRLTTFAVATAAPTSTAATTTCSTVTATRAVLCRAIAVSTVHRRLRIAHDVRSGRARSCAERQGIRRCCGLLFALPLTIALTLRLTLGFTLCVTLRIPRRLRLACRARVARREIPFWLAPGIAPGVPVAAM